MPLWGSTMFIALRNHLTLIFSVRINKAGPLPSDVVLLSFIFKQYYWPLRLPLQAPFISLALIEECWLCCHHNGSPVLPHIIFRCMPPLSPRRISLSFPLAEQHCSYAQRMSAFPTRLKGRHPYLVNEAALGSLALRPTALPLRNLRP